MLINKPKHFTSENPFVIFVILFHNQEGLWNGIMNITNGFSLIVLIVFRIAKRSLE